MSSQIFIARIGQNCNSQIIRHSIWTIDWLHIAALKKVRVNKRSKAVTNKLVNCNAVGAFTYSCCLCFIWMYIMIFQLLHSSHPWAVLNIQDDTKIATAEARRRILTVSVLFSTDEWFIVPDIYSSAWKFS